MAVDQERIITPKQDIVGRTNLAHFPWWFLIILAIIVFMTIRIIIDPLYQAIFETILQGIGTTLYVTAISFIFALLLGLLLGLGRVSTNLIVRNLAITYIEFIRGVPMLVLIFTISFAVVPLFGRTFGLPNNAISLTTRAIVALVLIYGAYIAEIFRAGIESIGRGQSEAARSLGMTRVQSMRYVILPQAIRNV
ncbi:MAG: ABC transporter permease subunit, partial [Oscillochloris sp.]|nr:ABC transporter permease subunit [Oscillochloris sp.]